MKTARPKFSELKMQAVFSWKTRDYLAFMTRNSRKVMLPRVLINAAANHIARTDRCLSNRELASIFQTFALTSWFTLQTVLSKWQTNSLVIVSLSNNPSYPLKETPSPSGKSGENQYTIEVIKDASSPAIFSKLRAFVIFNLLSKLLKFHSENRCQV